MERFLTENDKIHLESYVAKCNEVKQFALACLTGTHTGLMLFGHGGSGKSYSIRELFRERHIVEVEPEEVMTAIEPASDEDDEPIVREQTEHGYKSWVNHQGRITAKGLVMQMHAFPKSVHLIEDAETLMDDKNAMGLFRMALHSQDDSVHSKRRITWKTSVAEGSYDFYFHGSIIIVGNRLLDAKSEEMKAVQTRCPCMTFDITDAELRAKMKDICDKGYKKIPDAHLSKEECYDVMEFLLAQNDKRLNLRVLISGFRFMALGKLEKSIKWQAMVMAEMKQLIGASHRSRAERVHDEKKIAADFATKKFATPKEKYLAWCKATGRDTEWANAPETSEKFLKGFNAAKQDLKRKKA